MLWLPHQGQGTNVNYFKANDTICFSIQLPYKLMLCISDNSFTLVTFSWTGNNYSALSLEKRVFRLPSTLLFQMFQLKMSPTSSAAAAKYLPHHWKPLGATNLWQQEADWLYVEHPQTAHKHAHKNTSCISWARTVGAAVAMMQWRLRRGKRARSWMSFLHSWRETVADSRDAVRTEWQTTGTETLEDPCLVTLHGNAEPGVSASLAASRVMTVGEISHTSVQRSSETPTPCLLWAETK